MTGKSSWVPSRTQGLFFPLLQMALCIMVIARDASIPSWMRSKPWACFFINPSICFYGLWSYVGTVSNYVGNFTFKLNLLPLLSNQIWFVITLFHTLMMEMYLRTLCNMWHVGWIMYDLGCLWIVYRDPSWYSTDYQVYMGSSMTVRPLVGYHCTCALINWLVLWHSPCSLDETWWFGWIWNYNTCYGYYCMLLNDIPHVWHRIVANLEMDSYN